MTANTQIICCLLLSLAGCFAEIILTQSPSVDSVSVGSSVTLNCRQQRMTPRNSFTRFTSPRALLSRGT
ncbi:hypothetical protein Q8A67_000235 [Cirrhinus molitorella]|uniref:Immunoglobulin V-set domain-containing protein n=1 Tax=Cirrhinus molitorella TaxID=172907 RepID=A0AA88Q9D6_9TELE|nr:hypothetical protein Q8A67_000235 [Cirrhinus molitorella]